VALVVTGGEDEHGKGGFAYYKRRIAEFSSRYEKVLMLGDSMGAAPSCCSHPNSQLQVFPCQSHHLDRRSAGDPPAK